MSGQMDNSTRKIRLNLNLFYSSPRKDLDQSNRVVPKRFVSECAQPGVTISAGTETKFNATKYM